MFSVYFEFLFWDVYFILLNLANSSHVRFERWMLIGSLTCQSNVGRVSGSCSGEQGDDEAVKNQQSSEILPRANKIYTKNILLCSCVETKTAEIDFELT